MTKYAFCFLAAAVLPAWGQVVSSSAPARRLVRLPAASLGAAVDGSFAYCYDCAAAAVCAGGGTGAMALRVAGVWTCEATGGAGAGISRTTVSYSATPVFVRSSAIQQWKITLSGNVTSSTTSALAANDVLTFEICQDGTGSRTFAWPTGFTAAGTISAAASTCSVQMFIWSGAAAVPTTVMYASGPSSIQMTGADGYSQTYQPPAAAGAATAIIGPSASGTLSTVDGVETLENKTLVDPQIAGTTDGNCLQTNASTGAVESAGAPCGAGGGGAAWTASGFAPSNSIGASATVFFSLVSQYSATEANATMIVPITGSIRRLMVKKLLYSAAAFVCTVRKNGADTAVTVSVAAPDLSSALDLTNTSAVTAGDVASVKCVNGAGGNSGGFAWSFLVY